MCAYFGGFRLNSYSDDAPARHRGGCYISDCQGRRQEEERPLADEFVGGDAGSLGCGSQEHGDAVTGDVAPSQCLPSFIRPPGPRIPFSDLCRRRTPSSGAMSEGWSRVPFQGPPHGGGAHLQELADAVVAHSFLVPPQPGSLDLVVAQEPGGAQALPAARARSTPAMVLRRMDSASCSATQDSRAVTMYPMKASGASGSASR